MTNNTTFQLDNLSPNTNYSIYVRSYSGTSASAQSAKVYCSTLEDCKISQEYNCILCMYCLISKDWEYFSLKSVKSIKYANILQPLQTFKIYENKNYLITCARN